MSWGFFFERRRFERTISIMQIGPVELLLAFVLDLAIGDPRWLPHPVRIIGMGISSGEALLRRAVPWPGLAGTILAAVTVCLTFLATYAICGMSAKLPGPIGTVVVILLGSMTLALKGLVDSVRDVIRAIDDLPEARRRLSMIVGRDTDKLDRDGVLRAAIESLSENASDGVIAPLFYLAIGGVPLAMTYKAINTLDSMVGYKNERYRDFGQVSARLDDIVNFIPARITGLLIASAFFISGLFRSRAEALSTAMKSIRTMKTDGRKHPSPNSGMPEAAMAGGLGVRFGGPSFYGGRLSDKPYIGSDENSDYLAASDTAVTVVMAASLIAIAVCSILLVLRDIL